MLPAHKGISGNEKTDKLVLRRTQANDEKKCDHKSTMEVRLSSQTQPKVNIISKKHDPTNNEDVKIVEEHIKSNLRENYFQNTCTRKQEGYT